MTTTKVEIIDTFTVKSQDETLTVNKHQKYTEFRTLNNPIRWIPSTHWFETTCGKNLSESGGNVFIDEDTGKQYNKVE